MKKTIKRKKNKTPFNIKDILVECPKCGKKELVKSIFGSICRSCFWKN